MQKGAHQGLRSIRLGLIAFFFLLTFVLPCRGFAEKPRIKVLLLPFDMHSNVDISADRRSVMEALASSLTASGAEIAGIDIIKDAMLNQGVKTFDEAKALDIASKAAGDFAVLGSMTRLGKTTTVDWRILDLKSKGPVAFYFKSSSSEQELIKALSETSGAMYEKMLSVLKSKPAVRSGAIDRIAVTGNRRVDTEAIMKKISSKTGEPFSVDDVREDIRAVYGTGFFDDISADLSDTASGKTLTFIVKEMPFIKKIEIKGNHELRDDKIKEALTIKENTVLDRVVMGENALKIKNLYSEEGYYLASVATAVESDGVEATVRFNIDEGPEVKVRRITFIGNRRFSDDKLRGLMNTTEKGLFSILSGSGKFNEFIFQNDLALIIGYYLDKGYINADITDKRVLLSDDKQWFYITISINEGEQYRLGNIDVAGELLVPKEELLEKFKIAPGDVFNRSKVAKGIEDITDLYGDKGYAYADIRPRTQPNPETKTVDISIDIKKNDLVYIEKVDITGNVRTRDKVIRREVEVGEGDLYSSSALKRSRNNLKRLGYFEDVKISQNQGSSTDKMKLDVNVKERPTGSVSVGFGYSSVDKLIGTASISQSNLLGTGLQLDVSGTLSASSSKYILGFTEPWLFDKPLSAGFDVYNTYKEYPDFKLYKKGFDLRFGFPVYDRYTRGYLTYKLEDVNITDVADTASSYIQEQAGKNTESSIKAAVRRDTRDDAFFPTEGAVTTFSTEFAGGPLGGTSYFIKYEGDAIKFFGLPWDTTFSVRGSLGHIMSYDGHSVPIYEKYFLGGMNSIRGFEARSVGPKDPATGDLIGGTTMMIINTEFLFPIMPEQKSVRGVVFFDAGNAYEGRIDFGDIRYGSGFGIRWFSPIGPLRLELGFNLNKREGEKSQQWEFAIGSVF